MVCKETSGVGCLKLRHRTIAGGLNSCRNRGFPLKEVVELKPCAFWVSKFVIIYESSLIL